VHRKGNYYTSVRMFSNRLDNTDWPCALMGKKSHYIADGAMCIVRTGTEYKDIFPVWDWKMIPGATIEYTPDPLQIENLRTRGVKKFVGGASDDKYGMAAMDFSRGALTAQKAWFGFDEAIVCMGTNIQCRNQNPVYTTLNQCLLEGSVLVSDGEHEKGLSNAEHELNSVSWIHHDSIGYIFPEPANVNTANGIQAGNWQLITNKYGDEPISKDVFKVWLNHGVAPQGAKYCYIIVPDITASCLEEYARNMNISILQNTSDVQAVWHSTANLCQATFWKPGKLNLPDGTLLSVDTPCLLLLRYTQDMLHITVSNPENEPLYVTLEINRAVQGANATFDPDRQCSSIIFDLPGEEKAGSSLTQSFSCKE
jgi:chondroitin AC lyase